MSSAPVREGSPAPGLVARVRGAWRELHAEQQLAAVAALGLVLSMFLPWYQETVTAPARGGALQSVENSLIAFESWGFVEASILLVTIGVLVLLFARAERRAFHLPFGDGPVIMAAGGWTMFLVFYRQVDKPDGRESGALTTTIGVSWGIFIAFLLGALLTYAGWRIAQRHRPEPLVDGDDPRTPRVEGRRGSVAGPPDPRDAARAAAIHDAPTTVGPGEAPTTVPAADAPTVPIAPSERPTRPLGRPQTSAARGRSRRGDGQFEGQMSFDEPDAPKD